MSGTIPVQGILKQQCNVNDVTIVMALVLLSRHTNCQLKLLLNR